VVVAIVGISEHGFFTYIAAVFITRLQFSEATVASTASLEIAKLVVPKDAVGYGWIGPFVSSNPKVVINYGQIIKLRRGTVA
jgi:hypothetical protein